MASVEKRVCGETQSGVSRRCKFIGVFFCPRACSGISGVCDFCTCTRTKLVSARTFLMLRNSIRMLATSLSPLPRTKAYLDDSCDILIQIIRNRDRVLFYFLSVLESSVLPRLCVRLAYRFLKGLSDSSG